MAWFDDDDDAFQSSGNESSGSESGYPYDSFNTEDINFADEIDEVFELRIYPFERTLLGVVRPFFILLTTITNAVVVGFFFSMKNRKNASNLLFVSIAISDTLSGISMLPNSFYVFAGNNKWLSRHSCTVYMLSRLVVARMFHTVSAWQTVLLATQRLMCVCYPFLSSRLCTYWKTLLTIIAIYVVSFCLQLYHVLDDSKASEGSCAWRIELPCVESCIYMLSSAILQQILPCLILVVLTIIMLVSLQKASVRVSEMSLDQPGARSRRTSDRILTTTTIIIVVVFLIPELPYGIYIIDFTSDLTDNADVNVSRNRLVYAVYEVVLTITFHANFWIYCGTMSEFRTAILDLCACGRRRNRKRLSRTFSRSSSSRSPRANVSRTSSAASRNHRVLTQTTSALSTASDMHLRPLSQPTGDQNRTEHAGQGTVAEGTCCRPDGSNIRKAKKSKSYRVSTDEDGVNGAQLGSAVKYLPHIMPSYPKDMTREEGNIEEERIGTTPAANDPNIEDTKLLNHPKGQATVEPIDGDNGIVTEVDGVHKVDGDPPDQMVDRVSKMDDDEEETDVDETFIAVTKL